MKTIRRLYFYAIAFISVEVVLWGIIGLLRSVVNQNEITSGTTSLAQAISLILVGVPIFLFHWLWAQNISAKDDEENSATLRAVFLYGMLLATFLPAIQNFLAFINRTLLSSANLYEYRALVGGTQTWSDNLIAIVINLLIAAYFWNILKQNWSKLSETENFAEIRRLYRFIWMLYGLLMTIYGAQQALNFAFTLPSNVLGEIGRETVINAIALLVIGTPIWYFSWRILQDVLPDSAERDSYLRLGVLYLLTLGSVIIVLSAGGNLIYKILLQILGESSDGISFLHEIGGPISLGLPFAVVWSYYGKWLSTQFGFDENLPRRASKQRLFYYLLSFVGLTATFFGVMSLLSTIIDMLTSNTFFGIGNFASSISSAIASLVIGLPLWLMTWRPMQAQALQDNDAGDHARRSVIRKFYLYLVLFASVIGGMIAAGNLVFRLISTALGGDTSNVLDSSLNSLQALILFVVLAWYHLSALRKDTESKTDVLEEKQSNYQVLVFDHNGSFGESVKAMFAKRAPKVPVTVVNANEKISAEIKADAIVLPGSLAVNTPENVEAWIRSFGGNKLIVSDEAAGVFWMNDFEQAADVVKSMAEGQEVRPQSSKRMTSVWTYVAYVFAGLFACQLLAMLLLFGVSMVTGF
ncbi:MAG: hypothetical protein JNK81_04430 [Anaerolineales bacterium]|nr:hypothetical protein [Anaerolineales bacterium]